MSRFCSLVIVKPPTDESLGNRLGLAYPPIMKRLIAALILFLLPVPALDADYTARVVRISDGDTITVMTAQKKQVKIRLAGIDTLETGQDFGSRAKQAASELAFGKDVTIRPTDTDRYGRTVAEVMLPPLPEEDQEP